MQQHFSILSFIFCLVTMVFGGPTTNEKKQLENPGWMFHAENDQLHHKGFLTSVAVAVHETDINF